MTEIHIFCPRWDAFSPLSLLYSSPFMLFVVYGTWNGQQTGRGPHNDCCRENDVLVSKRAGR